MPAEQPGILAFCRNSRRELKFRVAIDHDAINHIVPGADTFAEDFGECFGTYRTPAVTEQLSQLLLFPGSPRMTEEDAKKLSVEHTLFVGVYPSLVMYVNWEQTAFLITEHQSATHNRASTSISNAPYCFEHPEFESRRQLSIELLTMIQHEASSSPTCLVSIR